MHRVFGGNILTALKSLNTHKKFSELLEGSEQLDNLAYLLETGHVSVFAPTDAAMEAYDGEKNAALIYNHIASAYPHADLRKVNAAVKRSQLDTRLTSMLHGHPPIWIRRVGRDLYVNQAKVSMVKETTTDNGKKQYLYIIDSVLEPLVPKQEDNVADYVDIKMGTILKDTDKFKIGEHTIAKFAEQVAALGMERFPEFSKYGKNTFFVPVDDAFQGKDKRLVDEEVVKSHIIPGNLLFTEPASKDESDSELFPTLQHTDMAGSMDLKVVVSLFEGADGGVKVQSQTITGNKNHGRGKVLSSIIKGNIPVQNGVVHLIDKPLVILTGTLWDLINPVIKNNKRFEKFANFLESSPELMEKIKSIELDDQDDTKNGATIFIPTNTAFDNLVAAGINVAESRPDFLNIHFLDYILESSDVRIRKPKSVHGIYGATVGFPEDSEKKNWIWRIGDEVFVDGGGVQASVVNNDIRATNGIIHQIDQVLGVPTKNMVDKLKSDPIITKTYELGEQEHFNAKMEDKDNQFTYLVPNDEAWMTIKRKYGSAYKVLFLGQFFYQAHHILERHLQVGMKLSVEQMVENRTLTTIRGPPLHIYQEEIEGETVTMVRHQSTTARIIRPNLETSNGYIHIIDSVIMKRRDVTLSGSVMNISSLLSVCLALVLSLFLD